MKTLSPLEVKCFDFSVLTTLECSEKPVFCLVSFPEYGTWSVSLRIVLVCIVLSPHGNGENSGFVFCGLRSIVNEVVFKLSCDFEPVTGDGVSDASVMSDRDFDGTILASQSLLKVARLERSSPRFNTHGRPAAPSLRSGVPGLNFLCSEMVVDLNDIENVDFFNDKLFFCSVTQLLLLVCDFTIVSLYVWEVWVDPSLAFNIRSLQ